MADVPALIAALKDRQMDLGPVSDCRSATAVNAWHRVSGQLAGHISALQNPRIRSSRAPSRTGRRSGPHGSRNTTS